MHECGRQRFDVFTDSQVLPSVFKKHLLSRLEARWLEFLSSFRISRIFFVKRRTHFFSDALSRALQILRPSHSRNLSAETFKVDLRDGIKHRYGTDLYLGPINDALDEALSNEPTQHAKVKFPIALFFKHEGLLHYENKVCVPRRKKRAVFR